MAANVVMWRRALRIVENRLAKFFGGHSHSPRHIWVLMCVRDGSRNQGECGEQLGINKNVMVELADEMESRGLVHRVRNPNNRREVKLCITRKGQHLLDWADIVFETAISQAFHPLTKEQLDELKRFATAIVEGKVNP